MIYEKRASGERGPCNKYMSLLRYIVGFTMKSHIVMWCTPWSLAKKEDQVHTQLDTIYTEEYVPVKYKLYKSTA